MARTFHVTACASLIVLIFLCLAWELRLAPLRPGGSWLVLKTLPLLAPLLGVLHGRIYTHQWAAMVILAYFAEGVVRATTETGLGAALAAMEGTLALLFFAARVALRQGAVVQFAGAVPRPPCPSRRFQYRNFAIQP